MPNNVSSSRTWSRRHQLLHVDRADEAPVVVEELVSGERRRGVGGVEPVPEEVAAPVLAQVCRAVAQALAELARAAARTVQGAEVYAKENKSAPEHC